MKYYENLPHHAYTSVFIPREEFKHGCIPIDKLSDKPELILTIPTQRISGKWYYGFSLEGLPVKSTTVTVGLMGLTTPIIVSPTTLSPVTLSPVGEKEKDDRLPNIWTDQEFIRAYNSLNNYPLDTAHSGKWVIELPPASINTYWQRIRMSARNGELGNYVEVTTQMFTQINKHGNHVIWVHTYDYSDKEDVFRICNKLRELGINEPIEYIDNEYNLFFRYGIIREPIYRA